MNEDAVTTAVCECKANQPPKTQEQELAAGFFIAMLFFVFPLLAVIGLHRIANAIKESADAMIKVASSINRRWP